MKSIQHEIIGERVGTAIKLSKKSDWMTFERHIFSLAKRYRDVIVLLQDGDRPNYVEEEMSIISSDDITSSPGSVTRLTG